MYWRFPRHLSPTTKNPCAPLSGKIDAWNDAKWCQMIPNDGYCRFGDHIRLVQCHISSSNQYTIKVPSLLKGGSRPFPNPQCPPQSSVFAWKLDKVTQLATPAERMTSVTHSFSINPPQTAHIFKWALSATLREFDTFGPLIQCLLLVKPWNLYWVKILSMSVCENIITVQSLTLF